MCGRSEVVDGGFYLFFFKVFFFVSVLGKREGFVVIVW